MYGNVIFFWEKKNSAKFKLTFTGSCPAGDMHMYLNNSLSTKLLSKTKNKQAKQRGKDLVDKSDC